MLLSEKEISNACEWLLKNAGPSIRYRTLTEVLHLDFNNPEVEKSYNDILKCRRLEYISSRQNEDGFFGEKSFHYGTDSGETYLRELFEMGIKPDHTVLRKGIECAERLHLSMEEDTSWIIGLYLEPIGRAGKSKLVEEWLIKYMEKFRTLYNYHREDWLITMKGKPSTYYLGIPFIYVIRTIANSWEWLKNTVVNSEISKILEFLLIDMAEVEDLYWISPKNQQYAYSNFLYIITSNYISNNVPDAMEFIISLEGLWLLAEFGIIEEFPNLRNAFGFISSLKNGDGLWEFPIEGITKAKSNWHSYHGFSLEDNWRRKESQIAELTFRLCLISERNRRGTGSIKRFI